MGGNRTLLWQAAPWLVVLALAGLCAWLLLVPLEALFARIPINYDEGWNAFHAQRLISGGPLYPPVGQGITINYPPLSFYVVGGLGRLVGDYVFAGRIVALASEAVVALNVMLIARRIGAGPVFATLAALSFALFTQVHFSDYVAMDDPQWLGHALQTSALVLLLAERRPASAGRLAAIVTLLLLGGLVKQSLVALPLAATAWIALRDRALLLRWLGCCVAGLVVAAGLAGLMYGWPFFGQVLGDPRSFTGATLLWMSQHILPFLIPFLLFGLGGFILGRGDSRVQLIGIYAAVSAIVGVLLLSAEGVNDNALFDLTIAVMPLAALLGRQVALRLTPRPWSGAAAALVLALPFLIIAPRLGEVYADESRQLAEAPQWRQTIDRLAGAPGPVICGQLALCYWAGRPSAVEFFNFGQRARRHPALADALAARIAGGEFSLIQEDRVAGDPVLPASVNAAVRSFYRVTQTAPTVLRAPAPAVKPTP